MRCKNKIVGMLAIIVLIITGCGSGSPEPPAPFSYSLDVPNIGTVKYTVLAENGGRVSWYKGGLSTHDKIAYDGKTQTWGADSRTDVYVMR